MMQDTFSSQIDRTARSTPRAKRASLKAQAHRASRRVGAPRAISEGLMAIGEERPVVAALFAFDEDGWSVHGYATEARSALRWFCGSDVGLSLVEFDEPQPAWDGWETQWTGDQYGCAPLGALMGAPGVTLADVTIGVSEWVEEDPWTRVQILGEDFVKFADGCP
jgi:hypothetical protein